MELEELNIARQRARYERFAELSDHPAVIKLALRLNEPDDLAYAAWTLVERSKNQVRQAAGMALKNGLFVRGSCEVCRRPHERIRRGHTVIAHHDDYNRPLDLRWLCKRCHSLWHRVHQAVPLRRDMLGLDANQYYLIGLEQLGIAFDEQSDGRSHPMQNDLWQAHSKKTLRELETLSADVRAALLKELERRVNRRRGGKA